MTPVLHPGVGSLVERLTGDGHLDEQAKPWRSCVSNFIKIGHQEAHKMTPVLHPGIGSVMERLVGDGHLDLTVTP